MECLPAVGNLSLLHECAPTGTKCRTHGCQNNAREKDPTQKGGLASLGLYCTKCEEDRSKPFCVNHKSKIAKDGGCQNRVNQVGDMCKKCKAQKDKEEKERKDAEAAALLAIKAQKAKEEKERKEAENERKRVWKENQKRAKEKRDKEKEAEGKIRGQMGKDFADRVDLEPEEWAAFFGVGAAQMGKDDAEKPKNLDVLLEEEEIDAKESDLIKHYTADRLQDAMQEDRKKCCTHDRERR